MSPNLREFLRASLKDAKRVAVVGVGSEVRSDDQAGLLVVKRLRKRCKGKGAVPQIELFWGSLAPENLLGEIKKYSPSHLILVDAADVHALPGTVEAICPESISGMSSSTHALPLNIFVDYIRESVHCKVTIIGIQPKTLDYDGAVSPEIRCAVTRVARAIESLVRDPPLALL